MPRESKEVGLQTATVRFSNGTVLEMPSLGGVVTQWTGGGRGLRSPMLPAERDTAPEFDAALAEVGIQEQETLHLDVRAMRPGLRSMTRQGAAADRVVLRPALPPREAVQIVWYQDESGGVTWHLPDGFLNQAAPKSDPEKTRRSVLRAARGATFSIATRTAGAQRAFAAAATGERLRGPIVQIGRKIFKILLVPLSKLVARPLQTIVGSIERRKRQELVRPITLQNYRELVETPFSAWSRLDGKPALLLVHGIFSTTHGMLSGFPPAAMERLLDHYEGRVIALDQLTVTRSPEENAQDFLRTVANARPQGRFTFDVLCHSRGGIVSRTLAERGHDLVPGHPCSFRKVFFVAAPNAGSALGDATNVVDMIDVFTNLLTNFPDGPVLYSLEVLLALVKLLAYAAETQLPGLRAMAPGPRGYIGGTLNRGTAAPPTDYAAAASNYEPRPQDNAFFNGRLADSAIDRVFGGTANDLVVPRDGVFAANGHPSFPLAQTLVYGDGDHVWHTDFFTRERTHHAIFRHFGIAVPRDAVHLESAPEPAGVPLPRGPRLEDLLGSSMPLPGDSSSDGGFRGGPRRRSTTGSAKGAVRGRPAVKRAPAKAAAPPTKAGRPARPRVREELARAAVERRPEIAFHEKVREGETNALTVSLSDLAGPGGGRVAVSFAAGEESVDLSVRLYAPGFEVIPDEALTMTVGRVHDPKAEQVQFQLRARNPGEQPRHREIVAELWLRNAVLGSVTHSTFVVPQGWPGAVKGALSSRAPSFALPAQRREDCDLVLMIEGHETTGEAPFRLRLRSAIPGSEYASLDCGLLQLPQKDLSAYIHSELAAVLDFYPNPDHLSKAKFAQALKQWRSDFINRLRDLGRDLWKRLPQKFREEYFRFHLQNTPPRSISVHSDEMLYPWELVIPNEKVNGRFVELPFLGISHVLGRWKTALPIKPTPQRLRVDSFVVINPDYPPPNELAWSVTETAALKKLFPRIEVYSPSTEARIRADLLKRSDVRLLHFSGHGSFDAGNANLSALLLEKGSLDALAIANTRLGAEGSPIVYLNACSVGALGITAGRAGGFAANCLESGFSGVLAPYWPVNDAPAAKFSVELYRRLLAGRAIGEALRDLRDENPEDPTYLAFAYFGDPWTRASFEPVL